MEHRIVSLTLPMIAVMALATEAAAHPRAGSHGPSKISKQRRIARIAKAYQRGHYRSLIRRDCSGLVISILRRAGLRRRGGTRQFWARAVRDRRVTHTPQPGDLAFFDRTYDANRNGRVDDVLTHIAVVTRVQKDGTVEMVHRSSRGVFTLRLNLKRPGRHRVGGVVVNDYLRARNYGKRNAPRLAGQLLRGFARPI